LDQHGFGHVRIVVSGGFTVEKIMEFERAHVRWMRMASGRLCSGELRLYRGCGFARW
jgi:hypothetical protein